MRSNQVRAFLWVLLLLSISGSASAQASRRNFTRPQTYDAEHYIIRVTFDRQAKKVIGDTTIRLKPLKDGFRTAEFDAFDISFQAVALEPEGKPLAFRTAGEKVVITLDKPYTANDLITLRFKHTATPNKGVYFVDKE